MEAESIVAHAIVPENSTVIRNLEVAFEEESKNCWAYKAYAARADEEGYGGLASLFRATARAEQIHASNHARVLRQMGRSLGIDLPQPVVEGTSANLLSALVDQKFEVAYLYPTFLTSAVPLFDSTAIRSFHWALEADKSHVELFQEVMRSADFGNGSASSHEPHQFFVCALCGYAAKNPLSENCPSCSYLWERFETIH
jgi:rubrerythrin